MEVEITNELHRNVRLFGLSLIGADVMYPDLTKKNLDEYADSCVEVFGCPAIALYYRLSVALGEASPILLYIVNRHVKEVL